MIHVLILLSITLPADAGSKLKVTSGASRAVTEGFVACIDVTVQGKEDGECQGKTSSPPCAGLRRALEFSRLKTDCLRKQGNACVDFGHLGLAQDKWVSVAARHLAEFGQCVRDRYGAEDASGAKEALADAAFVGFLEKLNDGSKVFGLKDGTVLIRALEGEKFSQAIRSATVRRATRCGPTSPST